MSFFYFTFYVVSGEVKIAHIIVLKEDTRLSTVLLNNHPLIAPKEIATKIGLNEALFLQQIHYWLTKSKHTFEQRKWVYNSYEKWQKQFSFWSVATVRRILNKLERMGYIQTTRIGNHKKRKGWLLKLIKGNWSGYCEQQNKSEKPPQSSNFRPPPKTIIQTTSKAPS